MIVLFLITFIVFSIWGHLSRRSEIQHISKKMDMIINVIVNKDINK